jgi:chemotaxis methyl-accepting protein methylase
VLGPTAEQLDPRLSRRRIRECRSRERARRLAERDQIEAEREEWFEALTSTRTAWMRRGDFRASRC